MVNARPSSDEREVVPTLDPGRGLRVLVGLSVLVTVASGLFYVLAMLTWHEAFLTLWYLFDVGREHNLATWFASVLWAALGACALLAGLVSGRRRVGWVVFAAVAFAVSVDEYAELHERLDVVGDALAVGLGVDLWFTWVLPGLALGAAIVLALGGLVWSLASRARALLVAGGVVFALGAIGLETLSGFVLAAFEGQVTWHYVGVTLAEEMCEMVGVSLAIAGLLHVFSWERGDGLCVRFVGWREESERRGRAVAGAGSAAR